MLGGTNYVGDLVEPDYGYFPETKLSYGLFLRRHLSPNLAIRANLIGGEFTGDDDNFSSRANRGFSFETTMTELSVLGEFDILGKRRVTEDGLRQIISPYVFVGGGLVFTEPRTTFNRSLPALENEIQADINADAPTTNLILPIGAGLKFDLSEKVTLGLELGYRLTNTDFLDGVSNSGNMDDNDGYWNGGLTLSFRFGGKDTDDDGLTDDQDECPEIAGLISLNGCPDTDGDGIADRTDGCPLEAGPLRTQGCPDGDEDGVKDVNDKCPDEAGVVALAGCPDADGDEIPDSEDLCPKEAGIAKFKGCPDTDGDGIPDSRDDCPNEQGVASNAGCPAKDMDGDGVPDIEDRCPDKTGTAENQGCPDTDFDGVHDGIDRCPSKAGTAANNGCPEVKIQDRTRLREMASQIQFETGKDVLTNSSESVLIEIAGLLKTYPSYYLKINGHTDNVGNETKNLVLSEQRARTCYQFLIDRGISSARMSFAGYGERIPIGDNQTEEGRRKNRRVELELMQP